ncbi:MAG: hypothetical protein E7258_05235 [Lachnospiraceae bacterium]|nr:hypothetical protein [Lachnospiraceae bacterium]
MKKTKLYKRLLTGAMLFAMTVFSLAGCKTTDSSDGAVNYENSSETKALVVGDRDVFLDEVFVYTFQNIYLRGTPSTDWTENHSISVKQEVISSIRETKILHKVAVDNGYTLDESDYETVDLTSSNYEATFGEELLKKYGITHETIYMVFEEQALVSKFETEIKNDMGRKITADLTEQYKDFQFNTLYYMMFPTVEKDENDEPKLDENGNVIPLPEADKLAIKEQAEAAVEEIRGGADYLEVAEKYGITSYCSETSGYMGSYSDEINTALKDLGDGDCTDIMEGELGYTVIYVITADDESLKTNYVNMLAGEATDGEYEILRNNWLATVEIDAKGDMEGTVWDDVVILDIVKDFEVEY